MYNHDRVGDNDSQDALSSDMVLRCRHCHVYIDRPLHVRNVKSFDAIVQALHANPIIINILRSMNLWVKSIPRYGMFHVEVCMQ
jgi:hypothetical protein